MKAIFNRIDKKNKRKKVLAESDIKLKEVTELGKVILDSEWGYHYREKMIEFREWTIDRMNEEGDPDPLKDNAFLRQMLQRIHVCNMLLGMMERDKSMAKEDDKDDSE